MSFNTTVFTVQKTFDRTAENTCETDDFDVGHKSFAALDSLNCVFVNIKTGKLQPVRKLTLGNAQLTAEKEVRWRTDSLNFIKRTSHIFVGSPLIILPDHFTISP